MNKPEIIINNTPFDFSPTYGAYIHKPTPTLTLVWDGTEVVPLEAYKLRQTDTVHANGDVSRTREITQLPAAEQLANAQAQTAIAREKVKRQLWESITALVAFSLIVFGLSFAYVAAIYAGALAANANVAVTGATTALSEIMYWAMWGLALIAFLVGLRYLIAYLSAKSIETTTTANVEPPRTNGGGVNILINQGEGYNSAQQILQKP